MCYWTNNLSRSQLPHLKDGDNDHWYLIGLLWELCRHDTLLCCLTPGFWTWLYTWGKITLSYLSTASVCVLQLLSASWLGVEPKEQRKGACPKSYSTFKVGTDTGFSSFGSWPSFLFFLILPLCMNVHVYMYMCVHVYALVCEHACVCECV